MYEEMADERGSAMPFTARNSVHTVQKMRGPKTLFISEYDSLVKEEEPEPVDPSEKKKKKKKTEEEWKTYL